MSLGIGRPAPVVMLALLVACGGGAADGSGTQDGGGPATPSDTLVMGDNYFEPSRWQLSAEGGTFAVTNDGNALHNVTIEAAGIDEDVPAGGRIDVEISLDPGEYEMVCEYHIAQGMTGTIVVE